MFNFDKKIWGIRLRKLVIASLILPFFTVVSPPQALAAPACIENTDFTRLSAEGAATVIYRFTNTGVECTFTLPTGLSTASILAVGGGGGGGSDNGAGGGGGELRSNTSQSLSGVTSLAIQVGSGGAGGSWAGGGSGSGTASTIKWASATQYEARGGVGGAGFGQPGAAGGSGGSGGNLNASGQTGGSGASACTLDGVNVAPASRGGSPSGALPSSSISGSSLNYSGGGGGGSGFQTMNTGNVLLGTAGGGTSGGRGSNYKVAVDGFTARAGASAGRDGATNTGGGGGGGSACDAWQTNNGSNNGTFQRTAGGSGAAGVVIISFSRISQTITFGSIASRSLSAGTFTVAPTSSSGLAVALASATPSICTVSGFNVTPVSVGTCTLNANQSGNNNFAAAAQVQQSVALTGILTFSPNHGAGATETQTILTSSSFSLRSNTFSRTGFRFLRWNSLANGTGVSYSNGQSVSFVNDTTLHAIWSSTISYDPNTATSTRAIESTTAVGTAANTRLSDGKLVPGSPVASGLLFNLNAADSSSVSGTTWVDINRNGISGAIVGSPTYNASEGYFQLDGATQYINLGSTVMPATGTNNFSTSVMFKADKPSDDNDSLIGRYHLTNGGPFVIRNWAHALVGAWRANTEPTSAAYNFGEINQATGTYNGTTWKLYINGQLAASAASGSASTSVSDLLIGALGHQASSVGHHFAGRIYSAQGYSRALSEAEVLANYQALLPGQKVSKTNFTLVPWNTSSAGTGTAIGSTVTDLSALPTPYLRLQPSNYNAAAKTWSSTPGSSSFTYRGTPQSIASNNGKFGATGNFAAIGGTTTDGIHLGNPTLTAYTLCVVARYRGLAASPATVASTGRIINAKSENWISGYYSGSTAQFHHNSTNNLSGPSADLNWHYHCDSGNKAYWDGVKLTPWINTTTTYLPSLSINGWDSGQYSDWELADLIIYDQFLPDSQIEQINRYLKNTYGIQAGPSNTGAAVSVSPSTTYASSGDTTLFANWGSAITYDGNRQSSGTAPSPSLISGTSGALATNSGSLVRAGFRFDGWNTNESGTGTNYAAGGSYPNTGNITLYAKWTIKVVFPVATSLVDPIRLSPYMRFKAEDYDATKKIWIDSSGNGLNTSLVRGTPSVITTASGNGNSKTFRVLSGGTADGIKFGNPLFSGSTYTLITVARYSGATKKRIFDGDGDNYLHSFFNGASGVAHHNGWVTAQSDVHGSSWVLGTSFTSNYRSNGVSRGTSGGTAGMGPLSINYGTYFAAESSNFEVAEVLIFNSQLTPSQIAQVEDYLASTYGITIASPGTYSTSESLAIGAGVGGRSDTYTATLGLGNKTFSMSPSRTGITLDTTTANAVVLVVSPTAASGTYAQTLVATDAMGDTATYLLNVNVNPSVRFDTSTATTVIMTHRRGATLQLNTVFGVGTKVFTMTSAGTGITLDTSTAAASGFATLRVDTFTAVGTYAQLITVTDDTKIRSTYTVTITINGPPTISSTSAITTTPVTSGLRLNLDAGDPASYSGSGTTWTDLSGNGKNATWQVNPTFTKDFGGAFTHARATNQYVVVPNLGTTVVLSVESWVKFDSLNPASSTPCVISDAYIGNNINYSICFHGDNQLKGGYHTGSWTRTSGFTPVIGTWYHLVYTISRDGNNYISTLYQNGSVVGTPTSSTMVPTNSGGNTYLGRLWDAAVYVNGTIPIFRVYNRALSTTEITQNYNALLPRFTNNPTNSVTITTTESVTASSSIYYAGLGTGNKTFSRTNPTAGISIDTSTVNTVRLNAANTLTATSTTVARTINETITATDSNGVAAATRVFVTVVVNPKIIITDQTPGTLLTTFGRIAYDTFTATQGTETKTLTVSSASFPSAFVMTNPSANTGLLTIANNLPAGTYPVTITATDSVGGITTFALTVVVNPAPTISGATGNSVTTTLARAATLRINVLGGTGARTITWTSPHAGITIESSTITAQNFITLNVSAAVPVRTYSFAITAVDSTSARVSDTFTVVVNRWPVIGTGGVITDGLRVNLDASTYSGSGSWNDTSGFSRNATLGGAITPVGSAPTFSDEAGGHFGFAAGTNQIQSPNPGNLETFSISTWVRVPQASQTGNPAIMSEYAASGNVNYMLQLYGGKIVGQYRVGSTWSPEMSGFVPEINKWIHITYVVSKLGTNSYMQTLYRDGVSVSTLASSLVPAFNGASGGVVLLGRRWDTLNSMTGDIAYASIYNRALTATEVLQNYYVTGSRFVATSSGSETLTVTQGVAGSLSGVVASQGTGAKTLVLSNTNPGITIDTSTANVFSLTLANTLTATSTTVARTVTETVTATDTAGAATSRIFTVVINPPIRIESTTGTITTTSGIVAWDTLTATLGTGDKTFALTGTPSTAGFTLTQGSNRAVLRVDTTVNPGTYNLVITATDSVGATTSLAKTVIVNAQPTITGNPSVAGTTGYAFTSQSYSAANGTGTLTYSITTVPATVGRSTTGITLSATTGSPTISVSSLVLADTYTVTLRVTDSLTAFTTFIVTLRVNPLVTISGNLSLTKVYGEELAQVYTTGGTGTAPFNIFASTICTSEKSTFVGNGTNGLLGVNYTVETFNGLGTCNWAVPKGVAALDVVAVGGGGGGGGGYRAAAGGGGGGGGGGALTTLARSSITAGTTYTFEVGSGGSAGAGATATTAGGSGASTFVKDGATTLATAAGGSGGAAGNSTGNQESIAGDGGAAGNGIAGGKNNYDGAGGGGGIGEAALGSSDSGSPPTGRYLGCPSGGPFLTLAAHSALDICGDGGSGGYGGIGLSNLLTGATVFYGAGGGGGGSITSSTARDWYGGLGYGGLGGSSIGGNGTRNAGSYNAALTGVINATAGAANTGSGGGGGGFTGGNTTSTSGGAGAAGTIIVRYVTPIVDTQTTQLTIDTLAITPTGLIRLNAPRLLPVQTYTQTITVRDSAPTPATTSATITLVVSKATPTLTLALPGSVTTAKYGNPVTISAVATTPGTVAFVNGSSNISACTAVATTAGLATCSWTPTVVGATTLRAILTPTDTANYNSSAQVNLAITVAKADTLTVTVASLTRQYTGSAVAVTGAFTTTGLVAIDSLTAISMFYSGAANTGTSRSATTAPTDAGIYTIAPNFPANASAYTFVAGSLGTTSALSNYESVTVVAGTLTINRAPQLLSFTYPNSNTATYSPTGTITPTAITRLDSAARTFSSSTLSKCTIDSATAVISIVEAGSCQVAMAAAQTFNYLAETASATVTINKASRTFSLTPAVATLKYSETTTVTATLSGGALDGAISYILGSPAGCTFDALSGVLTAISGTVQCPLRATIAEGVNYLAETTTAISLTIARASAPVITIDTITALSHTPGVRALVMPSFTVSGLKNADAANSLTFTYSFISNPFETFTYSDTRTPIDAGTYRITPSALTLSTGLLSNYETPTYSSSAINFIINRINQESITIENTNGEVSVPFVMMASGGNTNGALAFSKISGDGCSVLGNQLTTTQAGACVLTVTMAGNRNFLAITSETVTVRVRNFVIFIIQVPSNPVTGIAIAPTTPLTKGENACTSGCVPTLTGADIYDVAEGDLIILTGTNLLTVTKVYFNIYTEAPNFTATSDTELAVRVPADLPQGDATIEVISPGGTSSRLFDFVILP